MKFENEYRPKAVILSNEDLRNESFRSTTDFFTPFKAPDIFLSPNEPRESMRDCLSEFNISPDKVVAKNKSSLKNFQMTSLNIIFT